MNFTRDPIIETVITPREGCKLVVRSSKGANQEDYYVDAIEVVSFGHSFFFRSLERPKSFLVPISDYEIFESKEPKMALKNASVDRSIKISGGRETTSRSHREISNEGREEPSLSGGERPAGSERMDRKRDRQRRRSRRGRDRHDSFVPQEASEPQLEAEEAPMMEREFESQPAAEPSSEPVKAPSFISKLFPPPTTLIKETLSRYKTVDPSLEDISPMTSKEPDSYEESSSFEEPNFPESSDRPSRLDEETDGEE